MTSTREKTLTHRDDKGKHDWLNSRWLCVKNTSRCVIGKRHNVTLSLVTVMVTIKTVVFTDYVTDLKSLTRGMLIHNSALRQHWFFIQTKINFWVNLISSPDKLAWLPSCLTELISARWNRLNSSSWFTATAPRIATLTDTQLKTCKCPRVFVQHQLACFTTIPARASSESSYWLCVFFFFFFSISSRTKRSGAHCCLQQFKTVFSEKCFQFDTNQIF